MLKAACTLSAALALTTPVNADPIPIANAGFEAGFAADGTFPTGPVTDWPAYDPFNLLAIDGNFTGVINPTGSACFNFDDAPEGRNAALLFLQGSIGAGPVGLRQELNATLQPDTTYTLTAEVGNINSCAGLPPFDVFGFFELLGFPGYRIQLLAGGTVIAEDNNSLAGAIPEGAFRTSTVTVVTGTTHPQLGQPLEIRLINLNQQDTPEDPGIEVDFDDIRLDASPNACGLADLAPPFGSLDFFDVLEFLARFDAADPSADLAAPLGSFDFFDVLEYLSLFDAGCP